MTPTTTHRPRHTDTQALPFLFLSEVKYSSDFLPASLSFVPLQKYFFFAV